TNLFVTEQSGAVFCAKHKVLIQADDGLDYQITAGNLTKLFAEPITKRLVQLGVEIVYGATATSLGRPRGAAKTKIGFTTPAGDEEREADHVILAVKPQDAAKLVRWKKDPWTELMPVTDVITAVIHLSGKVQASADYRELGLSRRDWAF